jgi:hypothetical protein
MNFYQLYNLINEYGQSLIETLTEKFQKEVPTLTPTIIRNYIDRFDRIKNNLDEKDITKYTWKDLENTVDGYQPKQRIKAGTIDPTVTDANLLYNQDGVRIYLGKDKKSCIKYGNGYTFCISARGENNMYAQYRIRDKGTPYFIFNDKLPTTDNRHLMVLFVYEHGTVQYAKRYSVTLATNKPEDETEYDTLVEITSLYPWTKPLENFIDDKTKGTVDVESFEILEDWLTESFNSQNYAFRYRLSLSSETTYLTELLSKNNSFVKNLKELNELLNDDKKNLISMFVARRYANNNGGKTEINVDKFDDYETFNKLTDDLIKTTEIINDNVVKDEFDDEFDEGPGPEYKDKAGLENYIKTNKEIKDVFNSVKKQCFLEYPENPSKDFADDIYNKNPTLRPSRAYNDVFVIKLFSKQWIRETLDESPSINKLAEAYKEYYSNLNWLKQRTPEQLEMIEDEIRQQNTEKPFKVVSDIFAHFKKLL